MKNLIRNRQRDLNSFWGQDPFSLFFNDYAGDYSPISQQEKSLFTPQCHISDQGENFLISVDLPGVEKDDVQVEIKDGYITIAGERKSEIKSNDYVEKRYGHFERNFKLSEEMDIEKVKADFKNGELNLSIGKKTSLKSRKIEIG